MARREQEARIDWKHIVTYGAIMMVVVLIGGVAIWSFIEKQSLVIVPAPLPKVTVVTADPTSKLAASWVTLLSKAELPATLVPVEKFNPIEGIVLFCDVPSISPKVGEALQVFVRKGGAIVFVGMPPAGAIGKLELSAEMGLSDDSVKFSETVSPLMARLEPGFSVPFHRSQVALLKETPRMVVDARWRTSARAVVMHMEEDGARTLWLGFDPATRLYDDRNLLLLLKTAFRWVAGQPISDGAAGAPQLAKTLTPEARREARQERFAFSVDPLPGRGTFSVRMTNRGGRVISNPTVKIWLPPRVTEVALAGDIIMRRNASLTGVPEDGACLVSLASLARNEDRVLKIKVVRTKGRE